MENDNRQEKDLEKLTDDELEKVSGGKEEQGQLDNEPRAVR